MLNILRAKKGESYGALKISTFHLDYRHMLKANSQRRLALYISVTLKYSNTENFNKKNIQLGIEKIHRHKRSTVSC